jgi:hypothetical protein
MTFAVEGITGSVQYLAPIIRKAYDDFVCSGDEALLKSVDHNRYKSDVFSMGLSLV